MKTHQEKSSEVIIPLLEHGKLRFGTGRVSMLNIMIHPTTDSITIPAMENTVLYKLHTLWKCFR